MRSNHCGLGKYSLRSGDLIGVFVYTMWRVFPTYVRQMHSINSRQP